jgi:hypothetical protein
MVTHDLLRFDDKGSLMRQAYRPVFEAAVTYEPATGAIEVIANDKATRGEIVKATVTHLLGIAFKENRLPLRCYDLSVLLTAYDSRSTRRTGSKVSRCASCASCRSTTAAAG